MFFFFFERNQIDLPKGEIDRHQSVDMGELSRITVAVGLEATG